jgi:hypothetical protein
MDPKQRGAALQPYLKADPTLDDLKIELEEGVVFSSESIAALWTEIQEVGWDKVASNSEAARRDAGRDWAKVTGVNFGSDKAKSWRPDGWTDVLEDVEKTELEHNVAAAGKTLEKAIAAAAVDGAELERLKTLAGTAEAAEAAVASALAASTQAVNAERTAKAEREALPDPTTGSGIPCPCCGEPLAINRSGTQITLSKFTALGEKELTSRRRAIAEADGKLSRLAAERGAAERNHRAAQESHTAALAATSSLAAAEGKTGSADAMAGARAALAGAQNAVRLKGLVDSATDYYRRWRRADLILSVTTPQGLRAKKLGQAVDSFNSAILAPLCETADWAPVNLTAELVTRYGERPYALVSEGERWRTRVILQIAFAKIDGSSMVIVDNLPDLDSAALNGLLWTLKTEQMPALVCAASRKGVAAPDLAAAGYGNTWQIENARTKPLHEAKEAA